MTINEKKTTDVHSNKHVETENECTDDSNDDSCENDKKTAEL